MAELTVLESKLGEVMGLAMAAQAATEKVAKLVADEEGADPELVRALERMRKEAAETAGAVRRPIGRARRARRRRSGDTAREVKPRRPR